MAFNPSAAFSYLDKAEEALDGLQGWLDNTFESINVYGQEGVDAVCLWAGEWASYKIAQVEQQVVKGLHGAYQGALDALQICGPIYNLVTGGISANLGDLLTGLLKVAMPWVPPTLAAIQTMAQVPIKVISIAGKVADLASYKPPIQNPGITLDNFHIKPKSISMGDVVSGNFELPDPPQPFTTYMKESIQKTKDKLADERIKNSPESQKGTKISTSETVIKDFGSDIA